MADDTSDTSTTPGASKPATPRRRAPRKTSTASSTTKAPTKRAKRSTSDASTSSESGTTKAASRPTGAAKTRTKRTTAGKDGTRTTRRSKAAKATDKVGGKWGAAAIAGGVAAIGAAATAALLSMRGSTPKQPALPKPADTKMGAHQPDGTDASKSFKAQIADENTVPDKH